MIAEFMNVKIEIKPICYHSWQAYCGPAYGFRYTESGRKYWGSYCLSSVLDTAPSMPVKDAWKAARRIKRCDPYCSVRLNGIGDTLIRTLLVE